MASFNTVVYVSRLEKAGKLALQQSRQDTLYGEC